MQQEVREVWRKKREAETSCRKGDCFVTIKMRGRLRGCIGMFTSDKPLTRLVRDMAIAAATKDPQVLPLTKTNWRYRPGDLRSFPRSKRSSQLKRFRSASMGFTSKKTCSAVFFPSGCIRTGVGVSNNILEQTCLKAGLETECVEK